MKLITSSTEPPGPFVNDYSFLDKIQDLSVRKHILRELAKSDLYFLCKFILGYAELETANDFHSRLCADLDADPLRYLVLTFRGSFKTSIGLARCIQWILQNQNEEIGIGSDVIERAVARTTLLKDMVQYSEKLLWLFPDIFYEHPETSASLWRADSFTVKRTQQPAGFSLPTVKAFGLDPLPTGDHFGKVLLDDVENDKNRSNDDQLDKLLRNLELFFAIPKPGCPILMLDTYYSKRGPAVKYERRWPTYKRAITDTNGDPMFPSMYPASVVAQLRTDITDSFVWLGQYMMTATEDMDLNFYPFRSAKQIKTCQRIGLNILYEQTSIQLQDCILYLLIDPSGGAGKSDPHKSRDKVGWALVAVDKLNNWFVLELNAEFMNDSEYIEWLVATYAVWKPYLIAAEKMPHLESYLHLALKQRNLSLPMSELLPKHRAKGDRIRGLLPLLSSIYFEEAIPAKDMLNSYYTLQKHGDDALDALAYAIDIIQPPNQEQLTAFYTRQHAEADNTYLKQLPYQDRLEWEGIIKTYVTDKAEQSGEQDLVEDYGWVEAWE